MIIVKENIVFKKVKHEQTCIDSNMLGYAESIIQVVPTPIFIKDPDLRYISCNSAFLNLFDFELDQVIGNRDPFVKFLSVDKMKARVKEAHDDAVTHGRGAAEAHLHPGRQVDGLDGPGHPLDERHRRRWSA